MTADNFAIYMPFQQMFPVDLLESLAPGATVTAGQHEASIVWPDVGVRVSLMPVEQLRQHLPGLVGYIRKHGGPEALVARVFQTLGVAGCVIAPGWDEGGKAHRFCTELTDIVAGFAFTGDSVFAYGRDLIREGMHRPPAEVVLQRTQCLLACAVRGLIEDDAGKPNEAAAEQMRRELLAWVRDDDGRRDAASDDESVFLDTPIGSADPQERINRIWEAEAAAVMLWALGAYALPPFHITEHPFGLAKLVGIRSALAPALTLPSLRDDDELEAMRRQLTGVHWRLREWSLYPTKDVDFTAFAARGDWLLPFAVDELPLAGADLAINGAPLTRAPEGAVRTALSIAQERQRGIGWVLGVHPLFEHVRAPT